MDAEWQRTFRERMERFQAHRPPRSGEIAVSIKVRIASGCFHREHSPRAYELIDSALAKMPSPTDMFSVQEHESGPEILVYLAVTAAGLGLAKSIVELITAIIKARSEGIKKGDRPSEPLELIVRRIQHDHDFQEEVVLRIGHRDRVEGAEIDRRLDEALRQLVKEGKGTTAKRK